MFGPVVHRAGEEVPGPLHRLNDPLRRRYRPRTVHADPFDRQRGRRLEPRVECLADEQLSRTGRRRQPVFGAYLSPNVQLETAVGFGGDLMTEDVGLRDVTEGLVQTRPVGAGDAIGAWALHRHVQPPRGATITADPVGVIAVDPRLAIGEVGDVTTQLARRCAEGMELRERG